MPRYPNAPLVETIFEMRFPPELAVEPARYKFYNLIKKEFPLLYVPQARQDVSIALQPYKFSNEDTKETLLASIVQFNYIHNDYPGYRQFKKRALRFISIFSKVFNIKKLNKTGWRCINHLPASRNEEGQLLFRKYLNLGPKLGKRIPANSFDNIHFDIRFPLGNGKVRIALKDVVIPTAKTEILLLDLDYIREGDLKLEKIEKYMDESHDLIKDLFYRLISHSYMKFILGE